MKKIKLIGSLDLFNINAVKLIKESQIIDDSKINTESDFQKLKTKITNWENEAMLLFENTFEDPNKFFYQKFTKRKYSVSRYDIYSGPKETLSDRVVDLRESFFYKVIFLDDFLKILPELDEIIKRSSSNLTISQSPTYIFYLILVKLKALKDGEFYPIDLILEGNGIDLKNGNEELNQILDEMVRNKWINTDEIYKGKITLKGELHLEKLEKVQNKKESILVSKKIDLVIEKLNKLGYGQEILYKELEEMKQMHLKLNKKNWTQLVKGKLVDLTLSKVIDKTVFELITIEIFGEDFLLKLIKP